MKRFLLPVLISIVGLQTSVRAQETTPNKEADPSAVRSMDGTRQTTDGPELPKRVSDILTRMTESMKSMVKSGYYVGEATIAGILCDNLTLSNEDEDVQLWVAKGDKPVPRRIVVTYKNLEGQPQFWAQFEEWNFSPNFSETIFSYSPPAHADRISFFRDSLADELE